MEENKKEELEVTGENKKEEQNVPGTSVGFMLLAGAYLLYTGYKLCTSVLSGEEGASWGFFAAGAAFLVIGALMLFVSGKNLIKRNKAKREAEAEVEESTPSEPEETPKKMSIADRARLAGNVAEKEAQELAEEDESDSIEDSQE